MSDESLITAVSECPVLYDLTLKVVFPVLPPATINAVDPHSPPGNDDRRRGIVTSAATARSAILHSVSNKIVGATREDFQVSDAR
jgi:hypothetical protein